MRKLTESEIAKKRELSDALHGQKKAFQAERQELKNKIKVLNRNIKETERDFDTLQDQIISGEAEPEQMEME